MTDWTPTTAMSEAEQRDDGVWSHERPVGDDQLFVLFFTDDKGTAVDVGQLFAVVAEDAIRRAPDGWRLVSTDTFSTRQMGTAGNMFFQTGGQYSTQATILAVYARPEALSTRLKG